MADRPLSAVVLAAGEGTRMRSSRPKPLHHLCGRPMILHILDVIAELDVRKVVVVVGHRGEWVTKTLEDHSPAKLAIEFVEQPEQLGTGDALAVGLTALPEPDPDDEGDVVVLPGDTPLVRAPTLAALVRFHRASDAAATLLTAVVEDPTGYDRVIRAKDESVLRVVEGSELTADEQSVNEVATTIHCFRHSMLAPALRRLRPGGADKEHCLTGVYAVLHDAGYRVESLVMSDPMEAAGVNDRAQLAVAEAELRYRINERWMRKGVTMWDPESTYVDADVQLEPDVVLLPNVVLQGECLVASGAEIGPDCHLVDTKVADGAMVTKSVARRAEIGANARVGPYASLGLGACVEAGAAIGPFAHVEGPEGAQLPVDSDASGVTGFATG